jgi:hypothetical protein
MTLASHRMAFVSPYSLIDPSSGAAIATWRGLRLLDGCGFSCQASCAARLDAGEDDKQKPGLLAVGSGTQGSPGAAVLLAVAGAT